MSCLSDLRAEIDAVKFEPDAQAIARLQSATNFDDQFRDRTVERATQLVRTIRDSSEPGMMEVFLAEYGLSTDEGVALMCLAEALLRVPDAPTIDALIEDKIAPSQWSDHLGQSSSPLVNASTWALMLTGQVLQDGEGITGILRGAIKRLGEPVIRTAVARAMKELGAQFVLGETIEAAITRGQNQVDKGYTYSFDMLGEAAMTLADADTFFADYAHAIDALAANAPHDDIRQNPGISVKLSALFPRYETLQSDRVMDVLPDRLLFLAQKAKAAGIGLNVDAEEANRLTLSLDIIERVFTDPSLDGWDGFGVVVQAYGKRALPVLRWLNALAENNNRRMMVRLVKGAYWDTEVKLAQVDGLPGYAVYTQKAATDVSYICCARELLKMTPRIYPQFATHNAHTMAAILEMQQDPQSFEFQRLHGMGEALHDIVKTDAQTQCRIYAPVGEHRDLLAYLVRRLLENGANSSFVNQIVDEDVPAAEVAADPFSEWVAGRTSIPDPDALFQPERSNSKGWDVQEYSALQDLLQARNEFLDVQWNAKPILVAKAAPRAPIAIVNPADPEDIVGHVREASSKDVDRALEDAKPWADAVSARQTALNKAADLYEAHTAEICALLCREAGKTLLDAIAEIREAVDFLRYYAARAVGMGSARGVFTCISPWNFPLAIFTGQIAAALATGNAVLAKPADQTPLIACFAVNLLHSAGVPISALQVLTGKGADVGAALTATPSVDGVCFTGSTATAQRINRTMAEHMAPTAPLIAETGGINAMIVDSTALPEQATRDIVASAFQSAGQRCSALRVLYVQKDVAETFLEMLFGAVDELNTDLPWQIATDVGPVIDETARLGIERHIAQARSEGRLMKEGRHPLKGTFVAPTILRVLEISDLKSEIFGPVLHVATFEADELDAVIDDINASGFGLTFGMQSRIDDRIDHVTRRVKAGNIYINRNQIGAVVGSQPFGGEGLSGTGPKAGGPTYLHRFVSAPKVETDMQSFDTTMAAQGSLAKLMTTSFNGNTPIQTHVLPGPTGESNVLSEYPRGVVLCLGPSEEDAKQQAKTATENGCHALEFPAHKFGTIAPADLESAVDLDAVISFEHADALRGHRIALAAREGPLVPILAEADYAKWLRLERHVCVDTTAAGGNASLLAGEG